MVKDMRNN